MERECFLSLSILAVVPIKSLEEHAFMKTKRGQPPPISFLVLILLSYHVCLTLVSFLLCDPHQERFSFSRFLQAGPCRTSPSTAN